MQRSRAITAWALALASVVGCKSSEPDSAAVPAPSASSSVGLISFRAAQRAAPPPGFEACRDDFAHDRDIEAARRALTRQLESPEPSLKAAKALMRHRAAALELVAGASIRIPLPSWARDVRTSSVELEPFTTWEYKWGRYQFVVTDGILPLDALIAFVAQDGMRGFAARLYAVDHDASEAARTLEREGRRILQLVACAEIDDSYHRAAFRSWTRKHAGVRGVQLTASLEEACISNYTATVDFRTLPLGPKRALVIACLYEHDSAIDKCDELTDAVPRWKRSP